VAFFYFCHQNKNDSTLQKVAKKLRKKDIDKTRKYEKLAKKEAFRIFLHSFMPLLIAVILWMATLTILHLPGISDAVAQSFISFTLDSALVFGKILFIPVASHSFPNITVSGYTMTVVMECTAYNFYIFAFYLSLLSPVNWKQRLITLLIFLGAVFIVNNLRFVTMGFVGKFSPQLFHYIHDYLWNILFGFMVFIIWVWRYKSATGGKESTKPAISG